MNKRIHELNMTRGKPCKEQLDIASELLNSPLTEEDLLVDGVDARNYGLLGGISSAKKLIGEIADISPDKVTIFGNSSLEIMYELLSDSFVYGVDGSLPFHKQGKIKWLCPVPGYDRHFAMLEQFGVEMININMNEDGPDMDEIERLIKDESVKGIFVVPQYSNPSGISFSNEVVRRFARLKPSAKDFRIYWDNAYIIHHLYNTKPILNIIDECEKVGSLDMVYEFISTSKITFAGGGIAAVISSKKNQEEILKHLRYKTIGYDKINQVRHVKYLKDKSNVEKIMAKHASIIRPKFELVESIFEKELKGLASWSEPQGGYFITLYVKGIAKEVIAMCKERGVILTEAGCAFPYHLDPTNSVIRIAPTYPSLEELEEASKIICECVKSLTK